MRSSEKNQKKTSRKITSTWDEEHLRILHHKFGFGVKQLSELRGVPYERVEMIVQQKPRIGS